MTARAALIPFLILFALLLGNPALAASPSLELVVELDPATRRLQVQALVFPTLQEFRFELHESLTPTSATANGKALAVVSTGSAGALRSWRISLPAGTDRIRIDYGGTLPVLDRNLDHRGVLNGLPPMASREGSFLPAGSAWYPVPAVPFSYRVRVSVPADQRALVPGRLESEELAADGAGRYRATFHFPHPADGIDLMAGPYVVREKLMERAGGDPIRLRTYFYPDLDAMAGLADGYLTDSQRYLQLYGEGIGAYPFTEFSVVASPLPTGFGMPSLTYLGADVLKLPFIRATSLGHEVLHNWWGNGVYVDYARGNWCEGLTTFMADYAYKEKESAEAAREMRLGWLRDFAAVPEGRQQSLASFRSRTHGAAAAVGYGKSAMVFVMLRDALGEEIFRRGLRSFWEKYRFRAAAWGDLQTSFEQASGRSLDTFFDQWVNRAGGPAVGIAHATARPVAGKTRLTLAIDQSQPAYALRLPVEIAYPGRSEIRWLDVKGSPDKAILETDLPPEEVRIDPDLRVWRRLSPQQLPPILRQWIVSPSPRLAVASSGAEVTEAALSLASRLFEVPARPILLDSLGQETEPALLVGLHADVDSALSALGLPSRPANLAGRGTAQVWTIHREKGTPIAVASARDAESLKALLRPLPHYGSQSWLVFEGSRAVDKGVWPAPGRLVPVHRVD